MRLQCEKRREKIYPSLGSAKIITTKIIVVVLIHLFTDVANGAIFTFDQAKLKESCDGLFRPSDKRELETHRTDLDALHARLQKILIAKRDKNHRLKIVVTGAVAFDLQRLVSTISEELEIFPLDLRTPWRVELVVYDQDVDRIVELGRVPQTATSSSRSFIRYRYETGDLTTMRDQRRVEFENPDLILRYAP